jgi:hypothetical protein
MNSDWHLTPTQIRQFDRLGYLYLANRFPLRMLQQLKEDADRVAKEGFAALKANTISKDHAFIVRYFKTYLSRVTNFHRYGGIKSLPPLGCPQILSIAQDLCGVNFIPSADMLILKNENDELDLPWHQDMIYNTDKFRILAVGIYLEDAVAGQGALKLIENSQHQQQDIQSLMVDPATTTRELPAKAGDIVVHNPMLVHWSDRISDQKLRRTLYYEFRPIAQIIEEENWPQQVIRNRLSLLACAKNAYQQYYPSEPVLPLNMNEPWSDAVQIEDLKAIYSQAVPPARANFSRAINEQLKS